MCQPEIAVCSEVEKLDHEGTDSKLFSRAMLGVVGLRVIKRNNERAKQRQMLNCFLGPVKESGYYFRNKGRRQGFQEKPFGQNCILEKCLPLQTAAPS